MATRADDDDVLGEPPLLGDASIALRPWRLDDLPTVREASADPSITEITSVPSEWSDAAGTAFIHRQWGRPTQGHGWSFAIGDVETERCLGGFFVRLDRRHLGRASCGYWVVASARGRRVAGRALAVAAAQITEHIDLRRLTLYIEPSNLASQRTAERAGFVREGLLAGWERIGDRQADMLVYGQTLRTATS